MVAGEFFIAETGSTSTSSPPYAEKDGVFGTDISPNSFFGILICPEISSISLIKWAMAFAGEDNDLIETANTAVSILFSLIYQLEFHTGFFRKANNRGRRYPAVALRSGDVSMYETVISGFPIVIGNHSARLP